MAVRRFPDPESAEPDGLVAVGGDLEVESLLLAYRSGIFPWPVEGMPLLWFSPDPRAVLEFSELHVARRLRRSLRGKNFQFAVDRDFDSVLRHCAASPTRRERGTWITAEMRRAYAKLHRAGFAHSFECYSEERLVGGLYGVGVGGMFAAESMFHRESDASKAVLLFACETLRSRGSTWIDVQVMSPLLKSFGAKEIRRTEFLTKLKSALSQAPSFGISN